MKVSSFCCALFAAAMLFASAAPAQQPAPAERPSAPPPTGKDELGRYQILSVPPRATGAHPVAILLDTQFGRTWSLRIQPDGSAVWQRIPVKRFGTLPKDQLAKPALGSQ